LYYVTYPGKWFNQGAIFGHDPHRAKTPSRVAICHTVRR
jgi:hypothetical protein